jgi:outer membrane lipoprotein-sorting protein
MKHNRLAATLAAIALGATSFAVGQVATPPPTQPPVAAPPSIELGPDGRPLRPPEPPKGETVALLALLEARHGEIRNFAGGFDQLVVSAVFLTEIPSKGRFWYAKPHNFRCDYLGEDEITNLITEDAFYMHVPANKQVDKITFRSASERDQQLHLMALAFNFRTQEIVRDYEVRSSEGDAELAEELKAGGGDPARTALLRFTPWGPRADASPFARLKIWLDKTTLLPEKIWHVRHDGDATTMSNLKIETNVEIDDKIFAANFPGSKIIDQSRGGRGSGR